MRAQKNEQVQNGNSTNSQKLLFLLFNSARFEWGVKTLYC